MKIPYEAICSCGERVLFEAYGSGEWLDAVCPKCHTFGHMMDPLSISVIGERLLIRSQVELRQGDLSLCVIISAIAAEAFMSGLFFKMKRMDAGILGNAPSGIQVDWENEYKKHLSFRKKANAVSNAATNQLFDHFVKSDVELKQLVRPLDQEPLDHFQKVLLDRRNGILHQANMDFSEAEAAESEAAGRAIAAIFRRMDRVRFGHL